MKKQQGFVLVVTMVLLLAAAILGLYAMRGTIMQDKMTANIYNKTITTNTAEQGATAFLSWFEKRLKDHGWPTDESAKSAWKNEIPYINTGKLEANFGDNGYYWIDPDYENPCDANPCWDNVNKTVTVYITGNLVKDKGDSSAILGESIYKIELATLDGGKPFSLPELPAALTYAGVLNGFTAPSSGASINGGDKIAVATGNNNAQDKITADIKKKNEDNYSGKDCSTPCVSVTDLKDWGNAEKVKNLADQLASLKDATVYKLSLKSKHVFFW